MQGFNKYFPKDFDPSKHNSVNQHHGVHPLGDRARKLKSEGILIIRFELPFNVWCGGCDAPIGMGVRFNAEKKKVGKYYSTPIWSFRMKSPCCKHWFEIRTDPQNTRYVVTEGARQKVESFDPADAGVPALSSEATSARLATDPLYRLDHAVRDADAAAEADAALRALKADRDAQWADDYESNQLLRRRFRTEKKARVAEDKECRAVADRIGTTIAILPETDEDRDGARAAIAEREARRLDDQLERRKEGVRSAPILRPAKAPSSASKRSTTRSTPSASGTGAASRKQRLLRAALASAFEIPKSFGSSS
ncbi:Protein saf4 [Blastocladiella emersonii ATCC 22665]|nr:Protein saf4 [Blastocladiella emersonii ATCC 22665]